MRGRGRGCFVVTKNCLPEVAKSAVFRFPNESRKKLHHSVGYHLIIEIPQRYKDVHCSVSPCVLRLLCGAATTVAAAAATKIKRTCRRQLRPPSLWRTSRFPNQDELHSHSTEESLIAKRLSPSSRWKRGTHLKMEGSK